MNYFKKYQAAFSFALITMLATSCAILINGMANQIPSGLQLAAAGASQQSPQCQCSTKLPRVYAIGGQGSVDNDDTSLYFKWLNKQGYDLETDMVQVGITSSGLNAPTPAALQSIANRISSYIISTGNPVEIWSYSLGALYTPAIETLVKATLQAKGITCYKMSDVLIDPPRISDFPTACLANTVAVCQNKLFQNIVQLSPAVSADPNYLNTSNGTVITFSFGSSNSLAGIVDIQKHYPWPGWPKANSPGNPDVLSLIQQKLDASIQNTCLNVKVLDADGKTPVAGYPLTLSSSEFRLQNEQTSAVTDAKGNAVFNNLYRVYSPLHYSNYDISGQDTATELAFTPNPTTVAPATTRVLTLKLRTNSSLSPTLSGNMFTTAIGAMSNTGPFTATISPTSPFPAGATYTSKLIYDGSGWSSNYIYTGIPVMPSVPACTGSIDATGQTPFPCVLNTVTGNALPQNMVMPISMPDTSDGLASVNNINMTGWGPAITYYAHVQVTVKDSKGKVIGTYVTNGEPIDMDEATDPGATNQGGWQSLNTRTISVPTSSLSSSNPVVAPVPYPAPTTPTTPASLSYCDPRQTTGCEPVNLTAACTYWAFLHISNDALGCENSASPTSPPYNLQVAPSAARILLPTPPARLLKKPPTTPVTPTPPSPQPPSAVIPTVLSTPSGLTVSWSPASNHSLVIIAPDLSHFSGGQEFWSKDAGSSGSMTFSSFSSFYDNNGSSGILPYTPGKNLQVLIYDVVHNQASQITTFTVPPQPVVTTSPGTVTITWPASSSASSLLIAHMSANLTLPTAQPVWVENVSGSSATFTKSTGFKSLTPINGASGILPFTSGEKLQVQFYNSAFSQNYSVPVVFVVP